MNQELILPRNYFIPIMAQAYYDLLKVLVPSMDKNKDIEKGIDEGLGKFLSNLYISLAYDALVKHDLVQFFTTESGMWKGKRLTNFYSQKACDILIQRKKDKKVKTERLEFEHMIPKNIYQDEIVDAFRIKGEKSVSEIAKMLDNDWYLATITQSEKKVLLTKDTMPEGSNPHDIFARYPKLKKQLISQEDFLNRLRNS